MINMSDIVVTGGSGFIGKYVCDNFVKSGLNPINFDIKNGSDLFNISLDVIDKYDISSIVHMAANLEILNVDPLQELELNIKGTVHMLEVCRKRDIPKFVFISSADCYGEPIAWKSEEHDEDDYIVGSTERDTLKPFWSYASSKIAGEVYTKQYEELYGIKTVVIRPSIVTGVGEWYGRFVTLQMARIRRKEPMLIFGNGKQTRDFVPVERVADIITKATTMDLKTPIVLNAGSGKAMTLNSMVVWLKHSAKLCGYKEPEVKYIDPPVGELGRKMHEQINQRLSMRETSQLLHIPEEVCCDFVLTDEMRWIKNMPLPEFKKWMEKPRY